MTPDSENTSSHVNVKVTLRIFEQRVEIRADVPAGEMRPDQALPLLRKIDDVAVERAIEQSRAVGKPISCCRGCSACCRAQPVPVTPAEAYALSRLVEALPEPRRSEILARFADRERRLSEAGLSSVFLERDGKLSREEARRTARAYFDLGLACPFLADDGACGIYADRPLVCRQYLVTSPAELCNDPFDNQVEVLAIPIAAASALQVVCGDLLRREQYTVPLALALEYVGRKRTELERTFQSREIVERCLEELAGRTEERRDDTPNGRLDETIG